MRTTIEINDALARRVLEQSRGTRPFKMRDASAGDGGLAEGVDYATWETLNRQLYPPNS